MAPLATVTDVSNRLGRSLSAEEITRVTALLTDASAVVRSYTGQQISASTTTDRLPVHRGRVRLPQRPVTAVTAVSSTATPPVAVAGWVWDGLGHIFYGRTLVANGPDHDSYLPGGALLVTYTHGYDSVPDDIVAVVCQIVGRALGTPAFESGMTQESIANYSYQTGGAAASGPLGMLAGERAVLDRYRLPASSVSVW